MTCETGCIFPILKSFSGSVTSSFSFLILSSISEPTRFKDFSYTVTATSSAGCVKTETYTITVEGLENYETYWRRL